MQLDKILSSVASKLGSLSLSFNSESETLDHFVSFHSFEPVEGLPGVKEPKLRLFYMHIDHHSWTVSVGKSTVSHIDFNMNYVDIKATIDFDRVNEKTEALNSYIEKASQKKMDELQKLISVSAVTDGRPN